MRVDISQETDPGDPILEFPWVDSSDPKRRYVDIKTHPEGIADVEECRKYPALGDLLRTANSRHSVFRSAKCDVWQTSELTEEEQLDFALPFKVGSYVDLLLDGPDLSYRLYVHLKSAEIITDFVREVRLRAQLEIFIRRCLFHPEERWGYCLTVFTHAYGETTQEAQTEWRAASQALAVALEGVSREFSGIERGYGRS